MYNEGRVIPSAHLPRQKLKSPEPSSPHSQETQEADLYPVLNQLDLLLGLWIWNILQGEKEELMENQPIDKPAPHGHKAIAMVPVAQSSPVLFGSCPFQNLILQPVLYSENLWEFLHVGSSSHNFSLNSHLLR